MLRKSKLELLPVSLAPRGIPREQAAAYIGVSPSKFDQLVRDGRMPKPKRIDGRRVWSVPRLAEAFDALPGDDEAGIDNEWDAVCESSSETGRAQCT